MNLNSRKIRRLNIKSSFNRRCCRCCLNCFLQLGKRASTRTFDNLFVRLPSLCWGVCLSLVQTFLCSSFSRYCLSEGENRLLLKLLLKFPDVLKHTESPSSLAFNQNIKTSPERRRFSFTLKRNETTYCTHDIQHTVHKKGRATHA